jgi:hypothetical protein
MWEHFWALVCGSEAAGPSYREIVNSKMGQANLKQDKRRGKNSRSKSKNTRKEKRSRSKGRKNRRH